jgi:hypothetical protein
MKMIKSKDKVAVKVDRHGQAEVKDTGKYPSSSTSLTYYFDSLLLRNSNTYHCEIHWCP